jgi:two-component system phosphate regulon response regulator PhoB
MKILIIEDESAIRDMIRMGLELAGFTCLEMEDTRYGINFVRDNKPDLILLDWMLPGGSGIEFLRRLKRDDASKNIPVIMLTAKAEEDNKIQGFEAGADDYIAKPFAPRELVARIQAVLRRVNQTSRDDVIVVEGVRLDNVSHRVTIDDQTVKMGPTEYKLLNFFMSHQDRVYTRGQLLDQVWGSNVYVEERTVDVHIRRLRKALDSVVNTNKYGHLVQTVRGAGYRFSSD